MPSVAAVPLPRGVMIHTSLSWVPHSSVAHAFPGITRLNSTFPQRAAVIKSVSQHCAFSLHFSILVSSLPHKSLISFPENPKRASQRRLREWVRVDNGWQASKLLRSWDFHLGRNKAPFDSHPLVWMCNQPLLIYASFSWLLTRTTTKPVWFSTSQ